MPEEGELEVKINVRKIAQCLASAQFFINRIRMEFDKAGLTADLHKYEEEFKKEKNL